MVTDGDVVRIGGDTARTLERLAAVRGERCEVAFARAVGTERFFLELVLGGARILVSRPGRGRYEEVTFPATEGLSG